VRLVRRCSDGSSSGLGGPLGAPKGPLAVEFASLMLPGERPRPSRGADVRWPTGGVSRPCMAIERAGACRLTAAARILRKVRSEILIPDATRQGRGLGVSTTWCVGGQGVRLGYAGSAWKGREFCLEFSSTKAKATHKGRMPRDAVLHSLRR
jgi:hypothetical protein